MSVLKARHVYMTAEERACRPVPDKRTELIRGRLVVREPVRLRRGEIVLRMARALGNFLEEHPIGRAYAGDPGFTIERHPDTVRAPDLAYIRSDRVPTDDPRGFDELAPDLAIEIRSPGDRAGAVRTKLRQWLKAGVRLVWLIDPARRTAHVYRANGTQAVLGEPDALDGEDVLPGFRLALEQLLRS